MNNGTPPKPSAPLPDAMPYAYAAQIPMAQPVSDPAALYARSTTMSDDGVRLGQWETGLCGCFTHLVPNCLMATCCPCFSLAQISARINVLSYATTLSVFLVVFAVQWAMSGLISYEVYQHDNSTSNLDDTYDEYWWHTSDEDYGVAYHVYSTISCVVEAIVVVFVWHLRTKVRTRFDLPGNCCGDFWASLCCACCSIAQMATHVKSYNPGSCSFGPPDTLPAYPQDADKAPPASASATSYV
jgi:Cys-rich protein (TIGR01571 family)